MARAVAAPTPRRRAAAKSAGVSTSHRRPGHAPVSSIAPERRCRADESGPNCGSSGVPNATECGGSRCRPVSDEAALGDAVRRRSPRPAPESATPANHLAAQRYWELIRPALVPRRRLRCSVGRGCPSGVGSASTLAPSSAAAAAAASSGVMTVIEPTDPTPCRGGQGVDQHGQHHVLPGRAPRTPGPAWSWRRPAA